MPDVSIILPTRNNEDCIEKILTSIFSQDFEGGIEVVVIDSSEDETPVIVSNVFSNFNVKVIRVEPEDYNYGETRNLGAAGTTGDILVFLSADVDILGRRWLRQLVKNLENSRVAGVYGRQIPKKNATRVEEFFIKYTYPPIRKEYFLKEGEKQRDFFFSNTNSAIKRDVWKKIPLPIMLKSEDQEWAKRAILNGYIIVYDPKAVVLHSHSYTLKQVFQEYFDSGATLPYIYENDSRVEISSFLLRGLRYKSDEMKYFISKGYVKSIPYAIVYDLVKYLGYSFGTKCSQMPIWMRRILCKKSDHWDKYDDVSQDARTRTKAPGKNSQ